MAAALEWPPLPAAGACPGVGAVDMAPFANITPDGCGVCDGGAPGKPDAVEPWGVCKDGRLELLGWLFGGAKLPGGGASRLVERFMMSFPFTTRLSVDFLRSLVSISGKN